MSTLRALATLDRSCRCLNLLSTTLRRSISSQPLPARWAPPPPKSKVYVGVSGGVDSSVAARLLLEQGMDVRPFFMRNWDTLDEAAGSGGCEWERDWADVERVCRESLGGVKPQMLDFSREYWQDVFVPALDSWAGGATPNPDVACNGEIKFKAVPNKLLAQDSDAWIATGHYARLLPSSLDPSQPALHRSSFASKDQSYYLSTSPLAALSRTSFPLGDVESKDEVRSLARQWNLHTSERKESMGICFVGERKNFSGFIDSYLPPSPGDIEDERGRVVGRHGGLWRYTIGEGARVSGQKERMFIGKKDPVRNTIVIVPANSPVLRCTSVTTSDFKWISPSHPPSAVESLEGFRVQAQTRSLSFGALSDCIVRRLPDSSLTVQLLTPIIGVSPGQAVVLYDGTWCLGGGTIGATTTMGDELQDITVGNDLGRHIHSAVPL